MGNNKHEFSEKGGVSEELIVSLCKDAFFQDFCFKNPYYTKGKELCDILIILNDTAIIWQIKNLKLGENGLFSEGEIKKAIKQCRGAKRRLAMSPLITMINVAGEAKTINTSLIKHAYLIAAIEGGTQEFSNYYDEDASKGNVHIFYENFTRFAMKHLNTVSDFIKYLDDKEQFIDGKSMTITGGEEDLLAIYLKQARSFGDEEVSKSNHVIFDIEDAAEELENDPEYQEKLEADKFSEGWDMLIAKKREGIPHRGSEDDPALRDKYLAKMMSHNRFERRDLSKAYYDAAVEAAKHPYNNTFMYRRYVPVPDHNVTYLFAFMGSTAESRRPRQNILSHAALAARARFKTNMVIAVVSELHMVKTKESGFDWVLIDMTDDEVRVEITPERIEWFKKLKLLINPKFEIRSSFEYPSDARRIINKQRKKRKKK